MPRQQTARASARSTDNDAAKRSKSQQKDTKQLLSEVMGGDPEFADKFFGESPNMNRAVRSAEDVDGDMSVNGNGGANSIQDAGESTTNKTSNGDVGSGQHRVPRHVGRSAINLENTPHDIDHLVICQLHEDLDSYRYDVDFCKTQLDPENVGTITPAEARTFQLRLLDLGHQMRSIHHRIQVMQAAINNSSYSNGRLGASAANAYYGSYPPGTNIQAGPYQGNGSYATAGLNTPYDRQGRGAQTPSAVYSAYGDGPQERRGPGRPLGSKNRMRPTPDAGLVGPSAKAAALANAGAKRTLSQEAADGKASTEGDAVSKPTKKPRLDAGLQSPTSNTAEGQLQSEDASAAQAEIRDSDASDVLSEASESMVAPNGEATNNTKGALPSTPTAAAHNGFTPANRSTPAPASGDPAYTRLGRWMCTLCTSQKYLKHPAPKQPAEPSSWALRDISKIVTHFTRMHTEHTDVERLQELGSALDTNFGQFMYWIRVTKKTAASDDEIQQAVVALHEGRLPDLLRRLSTAAAQFPARN